MMCSCRLVSDEGAALPRHEFQLTRACPAGAPGRSRWLCAGALVALVFLLLEPSVGAATFEVNSESDSGSGSLREAITEANANAGLDVIRFNITGTPPHSIVPVSALPPVTEAVVIDGTTQPGYAGRPLIELNGASAGATSGLRLVGSGSTVRALAVNRFQLEGLRIEGTSNAVQACHIGCDTTGLFARPNAGNGILVVQSSGTVIGGSEAGNVVSGNSEHGIYILGGGSHLIEGNVVGLDVSGAVALANGGHGVVLYDTFDNGIGGAALGQRNLIAGNKGSGVMVVGTSMGNRIRGNYIGSDINGKGAAGNSGDGVTIHGGIGTIIGGSAAGEGNLIAANLSGGIYIDGTSSSNRVQGNWIGVDATGGQALGNRLSGVTLHGANWNQVGGSPEGARNVISGNRQDGITLTNTTGNTIQGNYVGVSAGGDVAIPNQYDGISLLKSTGNTIGGADPGMRNVVSGNVYHGIDLGPGSSGNIVQGNFVGTDATGLVARGNLLNGIKVESSGNTLGGLDCGNVVSGNGHNGILLLGGGSYSNAVHGNRIGTTKSGSAALMNGDSGILISDSHANQVGSSKPGLGNVVSGNGSVSTGNGGIKISGIGSTNNAVRGNLVGTDASGRFAVGNRQEGIYIYRANSNVVSGNVISGNGTIGLSITNCRGTLVEGNLVGVSTDGVVPLPNYFHGVELHAGTVSTRLYWNVVANTAVYTGVRVRDGATNNFVDACRVYNNAAMEIDLGNAGHTANDAGDTDGGGNLGQNHPVLTEAIGGNGVTIKGSLSSRSSRTYRIQYFASQAADSSGYGPGQRYLGEQTVTTSIFSGNVQLSAFLSTYVAPGEVLTATATDNFGNTSEFSSALKAVALPALDAKPGSSGTLELSWESGGPALLLKETSDLAAPVIWSTSTATPQLVGGRWRVTIVPEAGVTSRFYTLALP